MPKQITPSFEKYFDVFMHADVDFVKVDAKLADMKEGEFVVRDLFAKTRQGFAEEDTAFGWEERHRIAEETLREFFDALQAMREGQRGEDHAEVEEVNDDSSEDPEQSFQECVAEFQQSHLATFFLNGFDKTDAVLNLNHWMRLQILNALKASIGNKPRMRDIDFAKLSSLVPKRIGMQSLVDELTEMPLIKFLERQSDAVRGAIIDVVSEEMLQKPIEGLSEAIAKEQSRDSLKNPPPTAP